jgi:hypothetical protein
MNDFRDILKSLCDISILEIKQKKGNAPKYKVRYNKEEIELIFVDDILFNMFKK